MIDQEYILASGIIHCGEAIDVRINIVAEVELSNMKFSFGRSMNLAPVFHRQGNLILHLPVSTITLSTGTKPQVKAKPLTSSAE